MKRKKFTKQVCAVCSNWKEPLELEDIEGIKICGHCISDLQRLGKLETFMKEQGRILPERWDEVKCERCFKWIKKKDANLFVPGETRICGDCLDGLLKERTLEQWLKDHAVKKNEK